MYGITSKSSNSNVFTAAVPGGQFLQLLILVLLSL